MTKPWRKGVDATSGERSRIADSEVDVDSVAGKIKRVRRKHAVVGEQGGLKVEGTGGKPSKACTPGTTRKKPYAHNCPRQCMARVAAAAVHRRKQVL